MNKQKVIDVFNTSHKSFRDLLKRLTTEQLLIIKVIGNWTVKDIIAHLSAWNWEQAKEIDNILRDNPTWNKKYRTKKDQDDFNKKAVEERRRKDMRTVIKEWEDSFAALVKRIEKLTEDEWDHHEHMARLFRYEETGFSDEGHHANQIKKFLKMK